MIPLIKKLIKRRKEEITVLLFDDDNPHQQESYTLHPGKLFLLLGGINIAVILIVLLFFFLTPFGTMLFNKEDRAVRSSVMEINERVNALQDSLNARDDQLSEIQNVIRNNADTTFDLRSSEEWEAFYGDEMEQPERMTVQVAGNSDVQSLQSDQIIFSEVFSKAVMFPAEPPVDGSLTNTYKPGEGHYGIDIAARQGDDVRSVADGVVVSSYWTFNNGYVLHISHSGGYASVFKHFSEVFKNSGEVVRKGDIIGKVGETGLLASGPHIHFELWKNGMALDPEQYINLY